MKFIRPSSLHASIESDAALGASVGPRSTGAVQGSLTAAAPDAREAQTAGAVLAGLARSETFFLLRGPRPRRNVLHVKIRL